MLKHESSCISIQGDTVDGRHRPRVGCEEGGAESAADCRCYQGQDAS